MYTTASSLVAIAQYFWRIRTSVLYGNQEKFNIEAVNDYLPIWFERKFPIRRSLYPICKQMCDQISHQTTTNSFCGPFSKTTRVWLWILCANIFTRYYHCTKFNTAPSAMLKLCLNYFVIHACHLADVSVLHFYTKLCADICI